MRPGPQQKALAALAKLNAPYILLCAPTGSGKSEIAMAGARGAGDAFIVSHQNSLLAQYMRDFADELALVKDANTISAAGRGRA